MCFNCNYTVCIYIFSEMPLYAFLGIKNSDLKIKKYCLFAPVKMYKVINKMSPLWKAKIAHVFR